MRSKRWRRASLRSSTPSATTWRARRAMSPPTCWTLDAVNFGSGWFPTLRKRLGLLGLLHGGVGTRRPLPRARRRWPRRAAARDARRAAVAAMLEQESRPRAHAALPPRRCGSWALPRAARSALELAQGASGPRYALADELRRAMTVFDDTRLLKRVPIRRQRPCAGRRGGLRRPDAAHDLRRQPRAPRPALRGRARLRRAPGGPHRRRRLLRPGAQEREIRGCAIHACAAIARRTA